jgi:TolA-binding protein
MRVTGLNWLQITTSPEARNLFSDRNAAAVVIMALMLAGCATGSTVSPGPAETATPPGKAAAPVAAAGEVPELTLHLPENVPCACTEDPSRDTTFLEQGYSALLDGEYEEAMQEFERYQRLESSPRADLEAGIAIAYVQMLPRSPYYAPDKARASFKVLRQQNAKELKVNDHTRLMRQALLNLLQLQNRVDELKVDKALLQEDLKKREEALKRLRDLTLGQKAPAS